MIRLISYGDHLEKGIYRVHSRFSHAVNFVAGDCLATVVHPSVGGGPFNLVAEDADLTVLNYLIIENDFISLNDEIIPFNESKKYDSEIEFSGYNELVFKTNLHFLKEILIQHAPDKSLAFLLDDTRKRHFITSYEMELVRRFDSAMRSFNPSVKIDAVRMIKGAGFGLTPSGDDFIAGFFQALNLQQKLFKIDYRDLMHKISHESKSNNILTNAFLSASAKGWLGEYFKELILALFYDKNKIHESLNNVLSHGATSGADWCVGFLFGMEQ